MKKLENKVAVVTGANSGIGLATAKLFASEGAKVVLVGKRQDAIDFAVKEIGDQAYGVVADVTDTNDLDKLYSDVQSRFDAIDIVVANAGVLHFAPIASVTPDHFDVQFNVNVKGVFFTVQKALPLMRRGGSIVLISSESDSINIISCEPSGEHAGGDHDPGFGRGGGFLEVFCQPSASSVANESGMAGSSVYSASKAAVRSFARTWTSDLKDLGIRVNTLSPGPTNTPMSGKTGVSEDILKSMVGEMIGRIPLGRIAEADEIAKAVLFLASEDSSFVTGVDLAVDGGLAQI
jgi:NAD(P)-dependent dehydrogenase (short-subunit alcohol dehydrogenase family)